MTQSQATRSIIDTHRHIFGPKLRQKFVENIGFDDSMGNPVEGERDSGLKLNSFPL